LFMPPKWTDWLRAFRLRTLPLSLASIGMGGFLAASKNAFHMPVFALCCLTTVLLQILSNLANDLGDSVHGADHSGRQGPLRTVQTGAISPQQMKTAVYAMAGLCLVSGLLLLWTAFGWDVKAFFSFLLLGLVAMAAAVWYTMGRRPYGYAGLGDLSVLIFFGWVGVLGSMYLLCRCVAWADWLPATACGFFAVGVLNINNLRDIHSDRQAGKRSIPVRVGKSRAALYQTVLMGGGFLAAAAYTALHFKSGWQFLFLVTLPLFVGIGRGVFVRPETQLDPLLRQMAIATMLFSVLFGIGLLAGGPGTAG
jgi:1,4-dihydroxy-2-naphthoate octaprenyltransferase